MKREPLVSRGALAVAVSVVVLACGPDWDAIDPSLGGGQGGSVTTASVGGMSTVTTSSTQGGGGAVTSSSSSAMSTSSVGGSSGGGGDCAVSDNNDCTDDGCQNGTPTHTPTAVGTTCAMAGGKVCDGNGNCVPCNVSTDCGTDGSCGMFKCSQQHQCGGVFDQAGKACTDSGGKVCDGSGHCVECLTDAQCPSPATCGGAGVANTCGCGMSACATLGKTCGPICSGTFNCDDNSKDGSETDVDCGGTGVTCDQKCAIGKACTTGTDCLSGFCVDGVCCGTACLATCFACNVAGSIGTCKTLPILTPDTNPTNACTGTMTCDGAGICRLAPGQPCTMNGECASNVCVNNTTCM